jgi:hypothetical protein
MTRMTMAARPMVDATAGGSVLYMSSGPSEKSRPMDHLHMLTMLPFRLLP